MQTDMTHIALEIRKKIHYCKWKSAGKPQVQMWDLNEAQVLLLSVLSINVDPINILSDAFSHISLLQFLW